MTRHYILWGRKQNSIKEGKDEEFYQEARHFIMDRISAISCHFIIDISNEIIEMIIAHIAIMLSRNH